MTTALMVLPKKITPGEWVARRGFVVSLDAKIPTLVGSDATSVAHGWTAADEEKYYGGRLICESISFEGDAMLIASAPKLLAALEAVMPWLEVLLNSRHPVHRQAVTALLLARGGAHDPIDSLAFTAHELRMAADLLDRQIRWESMKI